MDKLERFRTAYNHLYNTGKFHSKAELARLLGRTRESVSSACSGKEPSFNDRFLRAFSYKFQEINENWLLNGEGEMLAEKANAKKPHTDIIIGTKGIPYYNVDFTLGFDIMENDQTTIPDSYIDFPQYNRCTCWVNAHGDSMAPTISSGDMVALKQLEDFRYLISGEIYAIVTKNGLRTIKRVNDKGNNIQLIPDNKDYQEQFIPKEELLHVFVVKGCMKAY